MNTSQKTMKGKTFTEGVTVHEQIKKIIHARGLSYMCDEEPTQMT